MPLDLATEQFLLGVVNRIVSHKAVLHSRVSTVARDSEGFAILIYVKHLVVECVRTIEVSRLARRVAVRVTQSP